MGEEENFAFQCQRDKRKTRIELVTYRAAIDCSTTELFPLKLQRVGLNYRPSEHEPDALPTELRCMVTLTGVEPATSALWARNSTVELQCIALDINNPNLQWFTYQTGHQFLTIGCFPVYLFIMVELSFRVVFAVCGLRFVFLGGRHGVLGLQNTTHYAQAMHAMYGNLITP